jgi:7-carboxy-7-deazaguanine synthase
MKIKISEIFRSIQGEGRNQGRPCTFIRFTGCNLNCAWCDTRYARSGGDELPVDSIFERVIQLGMDTICITGGEPLLQDSALRELLQHLHDEGASIEIETNGTLDFRPYQAYASISMDVKCPSSRESSNLDLLQFILPEDSVKFVVADLDDCIFAGRIIGQYPIRGEIFISPVEGSDYSAIAGFVLENALNARFQLQLHKIIGVK